ncbi:hypothetical protein NKE72_07110 [Streptococcus suis]|uniref:hypothetical protein n=1 Tax=Streptococcus suis TaxID=1307 RepID=UPI00209BB3C5|nr:hypothetical protein [Streptococcus suis]MCO8239778.1 hypothetical protein [Streptococcus suis]HEM3563002.1 hypothetical protein [Streptococcus suis]
MKERNLLMQTNIIFLNLFLLTAVSGVFSILMGLDYNLSNLWQSLGQVIKRLGQAFTNSAQESGQKSEHPPSLFNLNIDINIWNNLNIFGSNNHLSNNAPPEKEEDKNNGKEKRTPESKESEK